MNPAGEKWLAQRLKAAVEATSVPPALSGKVKETVRTARSSVGLYFMAAAAAVIICVALFNLMHLRGAPEEAILRKANGRLAAVLNIGLRDHLHCAVFRKYIRQPDSAALMAAQLGPEFAALAPVVQAKLPANIRLLEGHRCTAGDRQYVHFIADKSGKTISLVLTRKRAGESLAGGIYQEGVDQYQVVGLESGDYLIYVISDMSPLDNLRLAADLAPEVRAYVKARG